MKLTGNTLELNDYELEITVENLQKLREKIEREIKGGVLKIAGAYSRVCLAHTVAVISQWVDKKYNPLVGAIALYSPGNEKQQYPYVVVYKNLFALVPEDIKVGSRIE